MHSAHCIESLLTKESVALNFYSVLTTAFCSSWIFPNASASYKGKKHTVHMLGFIIKFILYYK